MFDPFTGLESVENAYREFGRAPEIQSIPPVMTIAGGLTLPGNRQMGQFRVKGAVVPGRGAAGAFLYTPGYPNLFLWSSETQAPMALIACDWLSKRRVALTIVVAIQTLARPDVRKIVFFGAGPWARQACEVVAEQWPNAEIAVVASRLESATAFAETMPLNVQPAADGGLALRGADVAVTLTSAREPLLRTGFLQAAPRLRSLCFRP